MNSAKLLISASVVALTMAFMPASYADKHFVKNYHTTHCYHGHCTSQSYHRVRNCSHGHCYTHWNRHVQHYHR